MANYGVIDLGSNSIRMVIYEVRDNSIRPFRSLINDKVIAGLSAYVEESVFSERGIKRAIDVLRGHLKRARYFNCERIDIFATAVLRNCANSREALAAIEAGVGTAVHLLSARDEAHLGFVGATCNRNIENGTLVDIGGGSTELTRIESGCDAGGMSIAHGSLSSYAHCVEHIIPSAVERSSIEDAFLDCAKTASVAYELYSTTELFGVGGSVRAAAKLYAHVFDEERPALLSVAHIDRLFDLCDTQPGAFAHKVVRAVPERVHTVIPGCVIIHTLMRYLGAEHIEICRYGVREGYLIERMLNAL